MKYIISTTMTIIALLLSAVGAEAVTGTTWSIYLILSGTGTSCNLQVNKVTKVVTGTHDFVKTYQGGVLVGNLDNGLAKTENKSGSKPVGQADWVSCDGCGDEGGKHLHRPGNDRDNVTYQYEYNANNELTGAYVYDAQGNLVAAELYKGGVVVSSYGMEGPGGDQVTEDNGSYTVVTTDINQEGRVILQTHSVGIPFGHVIVTYERTQWWAAFTRVAYTHYPSGSSGGTSGIPLAIPDDIDLDKSEH